MTSDPYKTARELADKYAAPDLSLIPKSIGVIPRDVKVGKMFRGTVAQEHGYARFGDTALVRRSVANDYAQFDNLKHPHAYGWHEYPLDTFKEKK